MEGKMPVKIAYTPLRCKYCDSPHVIRYGKFKDTQQWWCKSCKRKFVANDALPGMKTPVNQVSNALHMYYEGMSLNAIRRNLSQNENNYPSDSTVFEWIDKFTPKAISEAKKFTPNVGNKWVADETVLRIDGKNIWLWDIIDTKTRFLLATRISVTRTKKTAQALMEDASKVAGKIPKVVVTDKLAAYLDGIEMAFGADTKHKQNKPFALKNENNIIERFHGTLKQRTKVMRGLKSVESAKQFTDGWLVHYNFFKPHEYDIDKKVINKTPAEMAGIKAEFKDWSDITGIPDKPQTVQVTNPIPEKMMHVPERQLSVSIRPVRLAPSRPRISVPKPRITKPKLLPRGQMLVSKLGGTTLYSRHKIRGARITKRVGRLR